MAFYGFHVSQEQIPPSRALEAVVLAERAGFDGAFSSDHLAPWTPDQGESGNTLVWWGAALAQTGFPIGAIATPGQLYHPVITAHALATLAEMFPERVFAALGTGELLNEHVTGRQWPDKAERGQRLLECVEVIRALLRGEEVTHEGRIDVHRARLWSLPAVLPELLATATSEETASWAASWADGLMTVGASAGDVRPILDAYRDAGGTGEAVVQVHIAFDDDLRRARSVARAEWGHAAVTPPGRWDIAQPEEFARLTSDVSDDEVARHVIVADDLGDLAERLATFIEAGFERMYLHDVARDQLPFLQDVAPDLLSRLRALEGPAS